MLGAFWGLLACIVLTCFSLVGCHSLEHKTEALEITSTSVREACKVIKVYDGDTLACDLNGNGRLNKPQEKIRLLGVDATEMHYSPKNKTGKDQPFAKEATDFLKQFEDQTVYLTFDTYRSDPYNRTLAYVYATENGEESLNEALLRQGYVKILFIGKNRRLEHRFLKAAADARLHNRGLFASH